MDAKITDIEFDENENDAEETYLEQSGSSEDNEFDFAVGVIEDILLDEEFSSTQKRYCEENCDIFEEGEVNKLEYTEIFERYTSLVEEMLAKKLNEKIPGFNMHQFETMLANRKGDLDGEVFDLLMSLGDFNEFKDLMLSYKASKINDASGMAGLTVFGVAVTSANENLNRTNN